MKKLCLICVSNVIFLLNSYSQSYFSTSAYANSPQGVGANSIFGWGENFNRTIDVRPNPHPTYGTMIINYHTGLTFSAHSFYGGIRFYNQGYPNPYDPTTGSVMVMSIVNGSVGIGTTTPVAALDITSGATHVSGGYGASYSSQGSYLGWNRSGGGGEMNFVNNYGGGGTQGFSFDQTGNGTTFTNLMTILGSGNVGIGTANPQGYKLAVNGTAIATSMTVKAYANWPDYVFKKDYQLPPLTEIKTYIDQNHHLPDMPSAIEVARDGLNLGDMDKVLVKKVEELTLYLIEKDKEIKEQQIINDNQKEINQSLQKEIDGLKKQVSISLNPKQ
jgi:hypothetical protein